MLAKVSPCARGLPVAAWSARLRVAVRDAVTGAAAGGAGRSRADSLLRERVRLLVSAVPSVPATERGAG
jgi:hypothetical protein